jgi:DNA repair protein RecO (recombination protein O)
MIFKTEGIVIRNTNYSETSVISKIYTRQFGIQTYLINGVRNAKGTIKPSMLQLLMPLELVVYRNPQKEIQRIKELKPLFPLLNVHFDVAKSAVILFAAELLNHSVKEEEPNAGLFDFVLEFMSQLDDETTHIGLYPLFFAIQLSSYLGFYPRDDFSEECSEFLLAEGHFANMPARPGETLTLPESRYLHQILNKGIHELRNIQIPRSSRQILTNAILQYYYFHLPGFKPLKSINVLTNLL